MTTKYERQREERIAANKRKLAEMGLEDAARQLEGEPAKRQRWGPDLLQHVIWCRPDCWQLATQAAQASPANAPQAARRQQEAGGSAGPGH